MNKTIEELTVLLLYLTSWDEDGVVYDENDNLNKQSLKRSWKGYPFNVLNELQEKRIVFDSKNKTKSVVFTKEGEMYAKKLMKKYLEDSIKD